MKLENQEEDILNFLQGYWVVHRKISSRLQEREDWGLREGILKVPIWESLS